MPTTSQGIYYPDAATNVAPLHTVFSTMATSINSILAGDVQVHRVANSTARNALVSQFPPSNANPLFVWRADATNGQELEYTKNGTTWHSYSSSEDDTGWSTRALASGYTGTLQVRRIGRIVHFRGSITRSAGNFAVGTNYQVINPAGIPPGHYNPGYGDNVGIAVNVVGLVSYFVVMPDGSVTMRVSTAGNEFRPNFSYVVDA